jgi:hypothetical protein
MEIIFAFLWLGGSFAIATAADARGRKSPAWFFLALMISPLLAAVVLLAYLPRFEADGFHKGIPYRLVQPMFRGPSQIEAMLSGGVATFRSLEEFTSAIDFGTITFSAPRKGDWPWRRDEIK